MLRSGEGNYSSVIKIEVGSEEGKSIFQVQHEKNMKCRLFFLGDFFHPFLNILHSLILDIPQQRLLFSQQRNLLFLAAFLVIFNSLCCQQCLNIAGVGGVLNAGRSSVNQKQSLKSRERNCCWKNRCLQLACDNGAGLMGSNSGRTFLIQASESKKA